MTDKIVQQVIDKFSHRSAVGIEKYGTTLEQNNTDDYLNHLQEELMDATLYIQKLKSQKMDLTIKPTILTITSNGITASVTFDHSEVTIGEMFDAFKAAMVGITFTDDQIREYVMHLVDQWQVINYND
jgi:hypothetical protein